MAMPTGAPSTTGGRWSDDEGRKDHRERIVLTARGWLGTPYRHQGCRRQVGCDCLGLVRGVWRELYGEEPEKPGAYASDWAERSAVDRLAAAARRHCRERRDRGMEPGDILLFRWRPGLPAKHVGIVTTPGPLHPRLRAGRRDRIPARPGLAPPHSGRVFLSRRVSNGDTPAPDGGLGPAWRLRACRRGHRRGGRRARGGGHRPLAHRRHRDDPRPAALRRTHRRGRRGHRHQPRLRHDARRRHALLGDPLRGERHERPAGRQALRPEGGDLPLLGQFRPRPLRGRDRRHPPRLGRRQRDGHDRHRDAPLPRHRRPAARSADRGQAGRRRRARLSRPRLCRVRAAAARRLRQPHPRAPVRGRPSGRAAGTGLARRHRHSRRDRARLRPRNRHRGGRPGKPGERQPERALCRERLAGFARRAAGALPEARGRGAGGGMVRHRLAGRLLRGAAEGRGGLARGREQALDGRRHPARRRRRRQPGGRRAGLWRDARRRKRRGRHPRPSESGSENRPLSLCDDGHSRRQRASRPLWRRRPAGLSLARSHHLRSGPRTAGQRRSHRPRPDRNRCVLRPGGSGRLRYGRRRRRLPGRRFRLPAHGAALRASGERRRRCGRLRHRLGTLRPDAAARRFRRLPLRRRARRPRRAR